MADETFTKADVDKAIKDAITEAKTEWDEETKGLKDKNKELLGKLRTATEIKPEDLAALESENERLKTDLATAQKAAKDATKTAETATKALETEQGAARTYALEAEINAAIASGNIVPALVPAFAAMVKQNAKADLVDGKYEVKIGDKAAKDYISSFLESDDGKAFKAAAANGGGGAQGGGGKSGGKTMTRAEYEAMSTTNPAEASKFFSEGGKLVDVAA